MIIAEAPCIEFERRQRHRLGELNLTALIDIFFILIIFFMLTTSFMRIESMELILPSVTPKSVAVEEEAVHIFVYANGDLSLGKRRINLEELNSSLTRMIEKNARTRLMLLTAEGVTMQQLVSVMDRIALAGGQSLQVRKWESAPPEAQRPSSPRIAPEPAPPRVPGVADIRDLYGNF